MNADVSLNHSRTAVAFIAGAESLENHIMEAAERLARDYWEENRRQIRWRWYRSYLEGYDELNIGASFDAVTSHYSSLPGRWAMQMTILNTRGFSQHL